MRRYSNLYLHYVTLPETSCSATASDHGAVADRRVSIRGLQPSPTARHGFTILEVTLAIGLTTLLMSAIYAAMSIYWTTATESYDEVERAQIARAILRDMARDIRSCTFVEKDTMNDEDAEDDEFEESMNPEDALAVYTDGLFGTDRDLVLYINRPDRDAQYVSAQEFTLPTDRSSDSIIVRYLLAEEGGGGLSGQVAGDSGIDHVDDPVKGLARMEGDLTGLSNAIAVGDLNMQLLASKLIAAEVGSLRFEYFDGVDYVEEWDSTVQNAMPNAIVIELTLRTLPDGNAKESQEDKPGYLPPTVHRLVVPVMVSKPYVGEAAL